MYFHLSTIRSKLLLATAVLTVLPWPVQPSTFSLWCLGFSNRVVSADFLDEDLTAFIERARAVCAESRWLVLAKDPRQKDEAESAGFDIVLPVGTPAAELAETIQELVRSNPGLSSTSQGSQA